jgi:hypothetical protein
MRVVAFRVSECLNPGIAVKATLIGMCGGSFAFPGAADQQVAVRFQEKLTGDPGVLGYPYSSHNGPRGSHAARARENIVTAIAERQTKAWLLFFQQPVNGFQFEVFIF